MSLEDFDETDNLEGCSIELGSYFFDLNGLARTNEYGFPQSKLLELKVIMRLSTTMEKVIPTSISTYATMRFINVQMMQTIMQIK